MPKKTDNIAAQVAARVAEEEKLLAAQGAAAAKKKGGKRKSAKLAALEIDDAYIQECLKANRVGDATLYASLFRGKFVFVKRWGRWLRWGGHHWIDDIADVYDSAIEEVCLLYLRLAEKKEQEAYETDDENLKAKIEKIASEAYKRVKMLRDVPGRANLLTAAHRSLPPGTLYILGEEIDKKDYMMPCPNGVINLKTGCLEDGRPEDYLLNACRTPWNHELAERYEREEIPTPCPETEAFLLSSMDGDQELVDFLWLLLGYGLIRKRDEHIFTIFWGEHGRNGKDTLIKLITHVMGAELSGDVPVEMFLTLQQTRSSSAPSPDVLALRGMCFAWINEAEEGQRFALAKLKKLTGGSLITARGLQDKLSTTWLQTHLPIMTTNELPKAKADDAAFWHRAIIVKWPVSFVEAPEHSYERKADKHLDAKLQKEAEGVLIRLVRGATEYIADGLQVPEKVKAWTREQRGNWDDVQRFLEEWCIFEEPGKQVEAYRNKIRASDLHEAFCIWYARNVDQRYPISGRKFGELLNKKNYPRHTSNGVWRLGIDLNTDGWLELEKERAKKEKKARPEADKEPV